MENLPVSKFAPPSQGVYISAEQLEGEQLPDLSAVSSWANVVIVDACKGGFSYFPSSVREDYGLPPLAPRLDPNVWEGLVSGALEEGFALVARFDLLSAGSTHAPFPRSPFLRRYRHWLVTSVENRVLASADEHGTVWLAPWNPEVRDYLGALLAELCHAYPVDGIIFDCWQLPEAFESEISVPTLETPVLLPSANAPEDKVELEKELREHPYTPIFTTPYEESLARLMRAVRARARRGTGIPLTLLATWRASWQRTTCLLREGFAEGLFVSTLGAGEIGLEPLIQTPALVWLDELATENVSSETLETNGDFQALSSCRVVAYRELAHRPNTLKDDSARFGGAEDMPEFSLRACWGAITDLVQLAETLPDCVHSTQLNDVARRIRKMMAPSRANAPELERLAAELTKLCTGDEFENSWTRGILARLRNYLFLITNYHLLLS